MGLAQIKMPQLGESVTEGTVDHWLKNEGDFVKRDEPIVEVVTDKVNAEIPSLRGQAGQDHRGSRRDRSRGVGDRPDRGGGCASRPGRPGGQAGAEGRGG